MVLGKLVVCLIGIIMIIVGVKSLKKRRMFVENGVETKAKIIDYQMKLDSTMAYVYSFTLPNGKVIITADSVYRDNKWYSKRKVGETVIIVYNRDNPMQVTRKRETGLETGFYLLIVMGIVFVMMSIFLIR